MDSACFGLSNCFSKGSKTVKIKLEPSLLQRRVFLHSPLKYKLEGGAIIPAGNAIPVSQAQHFQYIMYSVSSGHNPPYERPGNTFIRPLKS